MNWTRPRFLGSLFGAVLGQPKVHVVASAEPRPIRRLHPRFGPFSGVVHLYHSSLGELSVDNLSLGGLLLQTSLDQVRTHLNSNGNLEGHLRVLGTQRVCELQPLANMPGGMSCRLVHSDQSVVLFLRPYLEAFQRGMTLVPVAKSAHKFAAQGLSLTRSESGIRITMKRGERDLSATFQDGQRVLSGTAQETQHQVEILSLLLFHLLGFAQVVGDAVLQAEVEKLVADLKYDVLKLTQDLAVMRSIAETSSAASKEVR